MKLIPYFLTNRPLKNLEGIRLSLFLSSAGKSVWKTDEPGLLSEKDIRENYLEPNGFVVTKLVIEKQNQTAWIRIDQTKTKLSEFYTWEEALQSSSKPECWRHFYWMRDEKGSHWWSPTGAAGAEIADLGQLQEILERIETLERS